MYSIFDTCFKWLFKSVKGWGQAVKIEITNNKTLLKLNSAAGIKTQPLTACWRQPLASHDFDKMSLIELQFQC